MTSRRAGPERAPGTTAAIRRAASVPREVEPEAVLLASRSRTALWALVVCELLFAVTDLTLPVAHLGPVLALKALQLLALALALGALPRIRSRTVLCAVVVMVATVILASLAVSGARTGNVGLTTALCLAIVLGAATWLPWGMAPQLAITVVATVALLVNLHLAQLGAGIAWSPQALGVALGLAGSVALSASLGSERRAAERLDAQRAAAKAALDRSAAELHGILANLEDVFYRADLDGQISTITPAVARYGYTVAELIGGDVRQLYRDPGDWERSLVPLLERGSVRDLEIVLLSKDRQPVPVSANLRLLRDADGRPIGLEGMLRDIRARKRSEEELRAALGQLDERVRSRTADLEIANARLREATEAAREAERRFRTVSQLTSDYAYCFRLMPDLSAVVEWITVASFERVTGYATDELERLGGGLGLVHPDDMPVALERLRALVAGESDVSEFRIIRKGGEVRWIREHGYPEREDGRVTRIYGAAQDVTDRKRAQEELAAALHQRENVMETVPDVIYSLDCGGRLVDWNRRFEVVTGCDRSRIEGTPATDSLCATA